MTGEVLELINEMEDRVMIVDLGDRKSPICES